MSAAGNLTNKLCESPLSDWRTKGRPTMSPTQVACASACLSVHAKGTCGYLIITRRSWPALSATHKRQLLSKVRAAAMVRSAKAAGDIVAPTTYAIDGYAPTQILQQIESLWPFLSQRVRRDISRIAQSMAKGL